MSDETKAWQWVTDRTNEGFGTVEFGTTENGDIGVWWAGANGGMDAMGVGDTALDAVLAAIASAPSNSRLEPSSDGRDGK